MDPIEPNIPKIPSKFTGERIALLLGGTLVGALVIGFGFKMATPIVKKVCQSILESPDKAARETRVASVEAIVVKPGTISRRITTVGKLRANEFVTLRAEMQGRIKEIAFKEGSMVNKGDVLIRFDDEELQAELAKAEADVEYRQVRFARFESLQAKGLGRGTEYDQERGQLNMARAAVEVAKAKLAKATIYAPFEGKIGLIDVSVGAIVDGQKELVTLVDFDPMKIDFKIPEKFIHDIGVGQTAEVKLDSIPDQIFQATVEAIDSRVDPQTHSIAVRATIPNADGKLQTGLFGSVGVIIGVKNDALLVPESALGREGDIEFVWVVVNGKTGRKRILTGTKENGQAEITAGLRPGEIVVTSGQLKLGEGTAVKISNMGGDDVEVTDTDDDEDLAETKTPTEPKKEEPKKEATPISEAGDASMKVPEPQAPKEATAEEAKVSNTPKKDDFDPKANSSANVSEKPSVVPGSTEEANKAPIGSSEKSDGKNLDNEPDKTFLEKSGDILGKSRDFVVKKFTGQ
jgi:membrane fusion protein (multidrug efflux system)